LPCIPVQEQSRPRSLLKKDFSLPVFEGDRLHSLLKNSEFGAGLKGHEFTRAENARRINAALQAAEKLDFSKSTKNGSHQDALGTIRRGRLMVCSLQNSPFRHIFRVFPQPV
jgi:hypothetical protein